MCVYKLIFKHLSKLYLDYKINKLSHTFGLYKWKHKMAYYINISKFRCQQRQNKDHPCNGPDLYTLLVTLIWFNLSVSAGSRGDGGHGWIETTEEERGSIGSFCHLRRLALLCISIYPTHWANPIVTITLGHYIIHYNSLVPLESVANYLAFNNTISYQNPT